MTVTAKLCKEQLEKSDPNLSVISIKDYGSEYLVTYIYQGNDEAPDPFLLVDKKNGTVSSYTIADNPTKYYTTPDVIIE